MIYHYEIILKHTQQIKENEMYLNVAKECSGCKIVNKHKKFNIYMSVILRFNLHLY